MKTALGRGLDALIPEKGENISHIDIDRILPGKQQPRKVFNESALSELSASIKEKGVLQPILVSRSGDGSFYLIAGERRWRAANLAGLKKIPAIIVLHDTVKTYYQNKVKTKSFYSAIGPHTIKKDTNYELLPVIP